MAVKNLHLEHLEDEIINNGIDGGRSAIYFLIELRKMLKGNSSSRVNMTVKWDGAPAIWAGPHPESGEFFVAKKSLFTKKQLHYKSEQEIKDAPELTGDLEEKFLTSFRYLSKIGMKEILQGDLMYTNDKSSTKFEDGKYITFQPNTILYAVKEDSDLGQRIKKSKMGIVFHTTYSGSTIEGLGAKFGANISGLKQGDVWIDDATYKDVSGTGSMTAKEAMQLSKILQATGKAFHGIKKGDLVKFQKVMDTMNAKGAAGATYKTYTNSLIRSGKFKPNSQEYINYVGKYWDEKVVAKVKQEKTKEIKREIGQDLIKELNGLRKMIDNLTAFQANLVEGKMLIINALNRVKGIGTFKKTDKGFEVVNPEGYVAIDKEGGAVKLVDRMEFAYNNFTAQKNWDK
tara:strand:- start:54 stop:1256 length:1203 start_codon:yes stop_codon:yes gene_type:complete